MSIQVDCSCGKTLKAKDEAAGRRLRCPACGAAILVPFPRRMDLGNDLLNQNPAVKPEAAFLPPKLDDDPFTKPIQTPSVQKQAGSSREWIMWSGLASTLTVVALEMRSVLKK